MDKVNTKDIEFTLIQNAFDSMERAIELLAWKDVSSDASRLKQAIQLIAHSIELLLKERLRRIHPSLIWEDVDKYPKLDARTVGVDRAIHRLEHVGGIFISTVDTKIIKSLRDTRNAIEHFGWQTDRQEADIIIGQGLSFAIQFARLNLDRDPAYLFKGDDTWEKLFEQHSQFAIAYEQRIEKSFGVNVEQMSGINEKLVRQCGFCNAMAQDALTGACSICGHWEKRSDFSSFSDFEDEPF